MADHVADVVKEVAEKMGKVAEEVADHLLEEGEDSKWFALCSPIAGQFAKSVKGQQYVFLLVEGRHGKGDRSRLFKKSQRKPITYPKKKNTGEPGKNDKCNLFDRC
ncbi:hypothetical protein D5086_022447 [Populus alba]|uniref:Uncharacterized protein n=1 Tax=Populus alba TaxID=43335 RepID=A0ACC4BGI9_POPAL